MKEWHDKEMEVVIPGKKGKGKSLPPPEVFRIPNVVNHFVMNLPATAIEFLGMAIHELKLIVDTFRGLYCGAELMFEPYTEAKLPMIHVYCFQHPDGAHEAILEAIRKQLGSEIGEDEISIHDVRNVAPNKVFPLD